MFLCPFFCPTVCLCASVTVFSPCRSVASLSLSVLICLILSLSLSVSSCKVVIRADCPRGKYAGSSKHYGEGGARFTGHVGCMDIKGSLNDMEGSTLQELVRRENELKQIAAR